MKIVRTLTLATATFLSISTASAATETFLSGTGTLNFQDNDFRAQGLLYVNTGPKFMDWSQLPPNTAQYNATAKSVALTFDSAVISGTDGKVSFSAANSQLAIYTFHPQEDDYDQVLPSITNLVTLRNITFDLSDASIHADVASYAGLSTDMHFVADLGRIAVFKGIAPITDGTQGLIANGQASGSTVGGLRLTDEGADTVLNVLYAGWGWPTPLDKNVPGGIYQFARFSNWGSASAFGSFTSSVPEASTQWMMFAGLLTLFAFSRRSPR